SDIPSLFQRYLARRVAEEAAAAARANIDPVGDKGKGVVRDRDHDAVPTAFGLATETLLPVLRGERRMTLRMDEVQPGDRVVVGDGITCPVAEVRTGIAPCCAFVVAYASRARHDTPGHLGFVAAATQPAVLAPLRRAVRNRGFALERKD